MSLINLTSITKHYEMGSQVVKALDGIDITVNKNDISPLLAPPVLASRQC